MEGEIGVTRSVIDELHSSDIQRGEMEGESGVPRSIIDEPHCLNIQGDQMEGESDVTRSIIDDFVSSDPVKWKAKVVLLEVSLMNFNLGISKVIKSEVKVV